MQEIRLKDDSGIELKACTFGERGSHDKTFADDENGN